jgi:hypothetical protein
MQVTAAAATDVGGGDRFDLVENRVLGRAYLSHMFARYGNWPDAVAAYNWGPGNLDGWIGSGRAPNQLPLAVERYRDRVLRDAALIGRGPRCSPTADGQFYHGLSAAKPIQPSSQTRGLTSETRQELCNSWKNIVRLSRPRFGRHLRMRHFSKGHQGLPHAEAATRRSRGRVSKHAPHPMQRIRAQPRPRSTDTTDADAEQRDGRPMRSARIIIDCRAANSPLRIQLRFHLGIAHDDNRSVTASDNDEFFAAHTHKDCRPEVRGLAMGVSFGGPHGPIAKNKDRQGLD